MHPRRAHLGIKIPTTINGKTKGTVYILKLKKTTVAAGVTLVLACTVLLSTAPLDRLYEKISENARLIKSEYKNIAGFFGDKEYSSVDHGVSRPSDTARPSSPELSAKTHTEVLPSPFNFPEKTATVASLGGEYLTGLGECVLTEDEKYGYTAVPAFISRNASEITSVLSAHRISYTTVTRKNTAPAGEVFAMNYAGLSDSSGYYINPNISVTLYVSAPKSVKTADVGNNLVYLTFDDGPSAAHNEALLDILDEYGIKGAFFTLGTAIEKNPDIAASITARGHSLGCHTMTHVYDDIYVSADTLETEVVQWERAVADAGITLSDGGKIFRFPGGSVGSRLTPEKRSAMIAMLEGHGYRIYDWNVSLNDAVLFLAPDDQTSYDYIKESFSDSLSLALNQNKNKNGAPIIVLMHESAAETPELLRWVIESLTERGLTFGNIANFDSSWMFSAE